MNVLTVKVIDALSSCRFRSVCAGAASCRGIRMAITVIGGYWYMVLGSTPDLPYERLAASPEELQYSLLPSIRSVTVCIG